MALAGVRMAVSTELESGSRLSEDLIKRVTGGEVITGRGLWQGEINVLRLRGVVPFLLRYPSIRLFQAPCQAGKISRVIIAMILSPL